MLKIDQDIPFGRDVFGQANPCPQGIGVAFLGA